MASAIDDLEFFATLAAAGSLTEAARHWGVSVSIVSRRLKSLEQRLGTQLANRGSRGLELTPEGREYRARGAEILQQIRDLENSITADPKHLAGPVRVVCTIGIGRLHIAPLIHEFRSEHPDVECMLELTSLPLSASLPGFDVAVHIGRVRDSALAIRQLLPNRRIVVGAPGYLAAHGIPQRLADLKDHCCLVIRENEGESAWRFLVGGKEVGVPVRGVLASNDGMAVTDWCLAGAGLAMRSQWHVEPHIRRGELVQVLADVATPEAHVVALFDGAHRTPVRVTALIDFLRAGLARRCA
ncbi:MAG: LysR family transcriptional regulator [Actinobacteria bacterium]|nr:LysR family transcriptional regulator [Actinomycetota bacterium]